MGGQSLTAKQKLDRYLKRGAWAVTREQFRGRKGCPSCEGTGYSIEPNTCGHCHGEGVIYPDVNNSEAKHVD